MSKLPEIKERLERMAELSKKMKEQVTRLTGPEGEEMKEKAKEQGKRIGVGAGVSFFGLLVAIVAALYILFVIILLVDIGLDKLWLSALIVVGAFLLIGGVIIAIGVGIIKPAAEELSKTTEDIKKQIKQTSEEMKTEMEELQKIAKEEAEERKKKMAEFAPKLKIVVPALLVVYLIYRILKRLIKSHREKRRILRVIESYEKVRTKR